MVFIVCKKKGFYRSPVYDDHSGFQSSVENNCFGFAFESVRSVISWLTKLGPLFQPGANNTIRVDANSFD